MTAYFTIERGQLICDYGEGNCAIQVAFDDAKPQRFVMLRSSDSSSRCRSGMHSPLRWRRKPTCTATAMRAGIA